MAALQGTFAGAGLLALILHAIGIELYLHFTPAEAERLREVSYERQLERGFRRPGSAGLTSDRLGDAEWTSPKQNTEQDARDNQVARDWKGAIFSKGYMRPWLGQYMSVKHAGFFIFILNHTAFKLYSLWNAGYLHDNLCDFYMCSRVCLLLYNPARCPDSTKPPLLLG
jgi:hypothetical protein